MLTLELDADGYPTEESLKQVAEYPIRAHEDCATLLAAVRGVWTFDMWSHDGDAVTISTGGWSGNESLVEALQQNIIFWMLCWQLSRRGGHFAFILPRSKP